MQVFNMYFKLLKKCIPIYLVYGLVFVLLLFVKVRENRDEYSQDYKMAVSIINNDVSDKFADNLKMYLEKYCDFYYMDNSKIDLDDSIYYHNIDAIISIPYGFMEGMLNGDSPRIDVVTMEDNEISLQLNGLVSHYINTFSQYKEYNKDLSVDTIFLQLKDKLFQSEVSEKNSLYDTYLENKLILEFFNVSGYILFGCLFVTVGTIINIFHDDHIKKRIDISLLQNKQMYGQIFLGNLIFTLCLDLIFIVISLLFAKNNPNLIIIVKYCFNIAVYSLSALALNYFFAILYDKKKNLMYFVITPIILAFISGVFVSQDNLREIVLQIGSFNPLYWFIKNNNEIFESSNIIMRKENNIFVNIVIQLLFAGVFFVLSSLLIKERRDRD
jgi:ABC-2 type transport system permease protein